MTTKPSLKHNASPEAFATAMVLCQGYAPACSDAEECAHNGDCFTRDGRGYTGAHNKLARMIKDEEDLFTRVWLKLALNSLEHFRWIERGAIGAKKVIRLHEELHK
jgi:hypothetical protein